MAALAAAVVPRLTEKTGDGSAEEKWGGRSRDEDASEEQCELMMEALRLELDEIKNQLAWLTYHLGESSSPAAAERGNEENDAEHVRSPSSRLSGGRSDADTPHTAKKKMEKAKEAIERATKAALAEKERKKHFLEVVDRAESAQRRYGEEYLRLLQVHVEQQRETVQENSRRLRRKMRMRERKEKALRVQSKPVRFRSLPSNDESSFLKKLYHSTYYQIIGIELQMRKAGKLQKLSDMNEFWELMLDLPSHTPPPPPPPPRLSHVRAGPTLYKPHPRLAKEEQEEEEAVEEHTSWALTDLPPEHNTREAHSRETVKSQSLSEPLRLPQVFPVSSLLNDNSSSKEQDNSQKEKARAHKRRIESVEKSRQNTRHMYQQARANEMVMRKLLPDIESLGMNIAEENSTTCDAPQTVSDKFRARRPGFTGTGKNTSVKAKLGSRKKSIKFQQSEAHPAPQGMESHLEQQNLSQSSAAAPDRERDVPLTINSLMDTGIVKNPKGKSALWSNYK